jgi:DNA primase
MCIAEAFPEWDVLSPGSVADFKKVSFSRFLLTIVRYYRTVIVVTDKDGAGTEAAICTKGLLLNKAPNIHIVLMSKDANEILVNDGKNKLREEVERHLPKM